MKSKIYPTHCLIQILIGCAAVAANSTPANADTLRANENLEARKALGAWYKALDLPENHDSFGNVSGLLSWQRAEEFSDRPVFANNARCNGSTGEITEIDLGSFAVRYHGSLPDLIGPSTLEILNLRGNWFTGPVPESITNLTSLRRLELQFNLFTEIPDLSGMQNLTWVNISNNHFDVSPGSPTRAWIDTLRARGVTVSSSPQHPKPEPEPEETSSGGADIIGEVELINEIDGQSIPVTIGHKIKAEDRIYTGLESELHVREKADPNGTLIIVRELSDLKFSALFPTPDAIQVRLLLAAGDMSADLIHGTNLKSDFQIKTPTATCSVRGTKFSVGYDTEKSETSVDVTEDGPIHFNPENSDLKSGLVFAGTDALIGTNTVSGSYQSLPAPQMVGYTLNELAAFNDLGPLDWEPGGQLVTIGVTGQISRIDAKSGVVTAIANVDSGDWTDLAIDSTGDLFVSDTASGEIVHIAAGADMGVPLNDEVGQPTGLAIDSSDQLYVESREHGVINTVSGAGAAGFFASGLGAPTTLNYGPGDALYVGASTGELTKIQLPSRAKTLLATLPGEPIAITFDSAGDLIASEVTDGASGGARLVRVSSSGLVSQIGSGFTVPVGFTSDDSGHLYIADPIEGVLYKATPAPLSGIDAWRAEKFGNNATNPEISGNFVDGDGDGRNTILEYASNTDPLHPDPEPFSIDAEDEVSITFNRNLQATDLEFFIEESQSLSDGTWTAIASRLRDQEWQSDPGVSISTNQGATVENVTLSIPLQGEFDTDTLFFRLTVRLQ